MRDIKFRVFDETTAEIYTVGEDTQLVIGKVGNQWSLWTEEGMVCDSNDAVLMQYTGLKDKNDQEIYEGDILKEYYEGEPDILVVSFEDGCFMVRQINTPNADYTLNGCDLGNTLVIGNIYENPELLEGVNVG